MKGLGAHAPLAVVVIGAAALFPLTAAFDRRRTPPPAVVQVLPPAALMPVLTFGHRAAAADLLELRATNFLMRYLEHMNRLHHAHVTRLYDAVLTLDPLDAGAYLRAAIYQYSVAGRPDLARALLERGLARVPPEHPQRWLLLLDLASLEVLDSMELPEAQRLERVRRAGELLHQGEGVPDALRELGRRMATRGLSQLEALRFEELQVWGPRAESGEPAMREHARARLRETRAAIVAQALQEAADRFVALHGRPPQDLRELQRFVIEALLQHRDAGRRPPDSLLTLGERRFDDPLGVGFRLEGARVLAPGLDAARLRRALEERLVLWRQRNPGATPTLADLGPLDVPPYLEARLEDGTVVVQPR